MLKGGSEEIVDGLAYRLWFSRLPIVIHNTLLRSPSSRTVSEWFSGNRLRLNSGDAPCQADRQGARLGCGRGPSTVNLFAGPEVVWGKIFSGK